MSIVYVLRSCGTYTAHSNETAFRQDFRCQTSSFTTGSNLSMPTYCSTQRLETFYYQGGVEFIRPRYMHMY
ncbi:hypothetical protein EB796_002449 [Bugula neritina]|uniref:Uncharacterized protein n=1 Tax=Bugula neritina TaxID=10212 RepID=A0A7J7KM65_BUGNE|nr:hypothetical protein EB796_002449 [Bugula neritina]